MSNKCKSCGNTNLISILNLGNQPWCNNFLKKDELGKEQVYPLELMFCETCELLQLSYTVPKEIMFKNHTYVSSTTNTLKTHFYNLALENKEQFSLNGSDVILDIGGNDGTQLLQYIDAGLPNVINVESADNIAELSAENARLRKELAESRMEKEILPLIVSSEICNAFHFFARVADGFLIFSI